MKRLPLIFNLFLLVLLLLVADIRAGAVPDTGQTKFYDNSEEIEKPVTGAAFYGQDAHYLRDRSYSKLDASGNALSDAAEVWSMVRDKEKS